MFFLSLLAWAATTPLSAIAAPIEDYTKDADLTSFVTRPDLRAPKFNIKTPDPSSIAPGYWFVAPYVDLKGRLPSRAYQPGQIGPAIFDGRGNLVWSGAHKFGDRVTFDFRPKEVNGSHYLSLILDHDTASGKFSSGAGIILNSGYETVANVVNRKGNGLMNMHEFNILDDGNTALIITFEPILHDISRKGKGPYAWVGNNGFQEVDVRTGEVTFQWWALDHVDPLESYFKKSALHFPGNAMSPYDFAHLNSVDKNKDGDYLVSARYTSAIYKVSGKDGSVIWQLGGEKSTFTLSGFNFSSQHDARFRKESGDTTEISFLNNAANGQDQTSETSSVMIIKLDHTTKEATLARNLARPDGQLTRLRGNGQELPNGNYFACWSENNYITEFDSSGRVVLEAKFDSHRFVNYRGYKYNFAGFPTSKPIVKAHAYGVTPASSTTVFYVSWNGATEVAEWKFYGSDEAAPMKNFKPIGSATKDGFETEFMATGYVAHSFAEAIAADGTILGRTPVEQTEVSKRWKSQDMKDSHRTLLLKNPPQQRQECVTEPQIPSSNESISDWMPDFMSEGSILLLLGMVLIVFIVFFGYTRRRRAWFEA